MNMRIVCTYEIDVLYTYKRKGKISHGLSLVSSLRIFNHYIASHIFLNELNLSTRANPPSSSQFE